MGQLTHLGHVVGDDTIHRGNDPGAGELVAGAVQLRLGHLQVGLFLHRRSGVAPQLRTEAGQLLVGDRNPRAGLGQQLARLVKLRLRDGDGTHFFVALELAQVEFGIAVGLLQGGLGLGVVGPPGVQLVLHLPQVRLGLGHRQAVGIVVQHHQDIARFHLLVLFHEYLGDHAADLGRQR